MPVCPVRAAPSLGLHSLYLFYLYLYRRTESRPAHVSSGTCSSTCRRMLSPLPTNSIPFLSERRSLPSLCRHKAGTTLVGQNRAQEKDDDHDDLRDDERSKLLRRRVHTGSAGSGAPPADARRRDHGRARLRTGRSPAGISAPGTVSAASGGIPPARRVSPARRVPTTGLPAAGIPTAGTTSLAMRQAIF